MDDLNLEAERKLFEKSGITGMLGRCTEPGYTDDYADPCTRFAFRGWLAARRAAPAAQLDAELPPLLNKGTREQQLEAFAQASADDMIRLHAALGFPEDDTIDADKMIERIVQYAERIRLLTEEVKTAAQAGRAYQRRVGEHIMAHRSNSPVIPDSSNSSNSSSGCAQQPAQSIDTPEFRALMGNWSGASHSCDSLTREVGAKHAWNALIAYIDGRTAGTAASEAVSVMLWLYRRLPRCYGRPPHVEAPITALAKVAGMSMKDVAESFAERAAAPSPQSAKEGANGKG